MNNKDIAAQFLCKDCENYNLCEYYHRRRKDSYICKYFHLSVTPQEPQTFKWCTDCKEYDQEKHSCHRWSKVIRDTVKEMKQEQEPILDEIRDKSIDEAIPILHDMYNYYNDADIDAYVGFDKEDNNAIEIALDTMRKYQKIKEIMDELNGNFYGSYLKDRQAIMKICEVLEDGNDRESIKQIAKSTF